MFLLSFAIMACAAGAMSGEKIDNAIQIVRLIEPLAGRIGTAIFAAGIVAAALSSLFPILLLAPWLLSDYRGKPCDMRSRETRLLLFGGLLCSLAVPIFGGRPRTRDDYLANTGRDRHAANPHFHDDSAQSSPTDGLAPRFYSANVVYIAVSIFAVAMAAIGIAGIGKLF